MGKLETDDLVWSEFGVICIVELEEIRGVGVNAFAIKFSNSFRVTGEWNAL